MGSEQLQAILTFWEESLPESWDFSDVDWAVSNCATDIRILLQTGELPSWIPEEARRG